MSLSRENYEILYNDIQYIQNAIHINNQREQETKAYIVQLTKKIEEQAKQITFNNNHIMLLKQQNRQLHELVYAQQQDVQIEGVPHQLPNAPGGVKGAGK